MAFSEGGWKEGKEGGREGGSVCIQTSFCKRGVFEGSQIAKLCWVINCVCVG